MSEPTGANSSYSLYYTLSIIAFVLTTWVISGSIGWSLFGAVLGLLFAAFFVNVLVKDRE